MRTPHHNAEAVSPDPHLCERLPFPEELSPGHQEHGRGGEGAALSEGHLAERSNREKMRGWCALMGLSDGIVCGFRVWCRCQRKEYGLSCDP
ncbi:hypothetical protein E2C01_051579 [Portunus trituberculatus]|uniref:Uncharacterized protein n=1 Tax=Portunus trituberculatus TaxID=210409 RepID=A0A5B7GJ42_PORTR|nr:hypothetical protein [Portunus trituberculatus]